MVDATPLAELPRSSVALRSQKVCDFEPVAVSEIRIKSPAQTFLLKKESNGWMQKEPTEEKADNVAVAALLEAARLPANKRVSRSCAKCVTHKLNPPLLTIQIRETRVGRTSCRPPRIMSSFSTSISAGWTRRERCFTPSSTETRPFWRCRTRCWKCCPRTRWRSAIDRLLHQPPATVRN